MSSLRRTGICTLLVVLGLGVAISPAWGGSRQARVHFNRFISLFFPFDGHPDPACTGLVGPVFGLCNAFCKQQNCDVRPNTVTCDILRQNFEQLTRRSTFPCEGQQAPIPTSTREGTNTPTETPVSPDEDTPTPTATHTLAVPTGTVNATATETLAVPTDTATPTESSMPTDTATPDATPTQTLAVPTGTAGATATETPPLQPTPTDTSAPSTDTATPTETPPPAATDTETAMPTSTSTSTPTPTETPTVIECPIEAGVYTLTQVSGGFLAVDGLTPFPFPSGGTVVQHVYPAGSSQCVHDTVVPFPGGFGAPVFCIPSLNFSVRVEQTACGIGQFDSDGGSDFTVTEIGDTSSPDVCGMPASNCNTPPGDSNVQVNVTVGGNGPDACSGGGTANAIVSVPVRTTTWSHVPTINCVLSGPDPDGMPGGMGDSTVVEFPQILDFTTDTNSADWSDLDPDGCCMAGNGPASAQDCAFGGGGPSGLSSTGTCVDFAGIGVAGADVTSVASGTIGSNGSPLYDLTFTTSLPNELSGPSAAATATCTTPPQINFSGLTMRCINPAAAPVVGGASERSHPKPRVRARSAPRRG